MKSKQKTDEPELTGAQVAEYLSANPDFFSDRDSLLALMTLPHQQGGAVSLVERQVSVLRDRNRSTKNHLDDLLNAALKLFVCTVNHDECFILYGDTMLI